jgi:hypothetical protein
MTTFDACVHFVETRLHLVFKITYSKIQGVTIVPSNLKGPDPVRSY